MTTSIQCHSFIMMASTESKGRIKFTVLFGCTFQNIIYEKDALKIVIVCFYNELTVPCRTSVIGLQDALAVRRF